MGPKLTSTWFQALTLPEHTLSRKILGLTFPNPIGLAAGFDKNGYLLPIASALGFGYIEVGSVTYLPTAGNPRPRMFRLPSQQALFNRVGLPSEGAHAVHDRIQEARTQGLDLPVGINIAKTPDPKIYGDAALNDYCNSIRILAPVADYLALNISCPNSHDGRTFEAPEALGDLLKAVTGEFPHSPPILLKLGLGHSQSTYDSIFEISEAHGISGYILGNTLPSVQNDISGGLSGQPLRPHAVRVLRWARSILPRDKAVISCGGIDCFQEARLRRAHGADLLQIYSALVYEGPGFIPELLLQFSQEMGSTLKIPNDSQSN